MNAPESGPVPVRRAVVDIGTNSVKLLVGDVGDGGVNPVLELSRQTRLGRDFYPRRRLHPGPVAETAAAVAEFCRQARATGAAAVRAFATSAAREAVNPETLLEAVRAAAGLEVEILTGDQEARWSFAGVMSDPRLRDVTALVLDVGGGSTEVTLGRRDRIRCHCSLPLGAVRLLHELAPPDPPTPTDLERAEQRVRAFLDTELAPRLQPRLAEFPPDTVELVGTGGTATVLAMMAQGWTRFERERVDGYTLRRCAVAEWLERLWSLPLARRRQIPGLPPERADVILTGVLIYEAVMARFGFPALRVSTRGLRYAALLEWPADCGVAKRELSV